VPFKHVFWPSAFLVLCGVILAIVFEEHSAISIFIITKPLISSLLIGSALGILLFLGIWLLMRKLANYFLELTDISRQLNVFFRNFSYPQIIVISVVAGVGEELLFRGVIQNYLVYLTNLWLGIVLAALIFGVLHYLNRSYVVFATLIGVMIGYLYHHTNDLYLVMSLHAVYDFCAFTAIIKFPTWFGIAPYDSELRH